MIEQHLSVAYHAIDTNVALPMDTVASAVCASGNESCYLLEHLSFNKITSIYCTSVRNCFCCSGCAGYSSMS